MLAYREFGDASAFSIVAGGTIADARTGKNDRDALVGLVRQSVFGRLAGYEVVNDATTGDALCRRRQGGSGAAGSPRYMGRFETW